MCDRDAYTGLDFHNFNTGSRENAKMHRDKEQIRYCNDPFVRLKIPQWSLYEGTEQKKQQFSGFEQNSADHKLIYTD